MSYTSLLPLRQHQQEAIDKARGKRAFGYLLDIGCGKSATQLAEFGELESAGEIDDILIISPAGCYLNWVVDRTEFQRAEINKHLSPDLNDRLIWGAWASYAGINHRRALERLLQSRGRPRLLTVNVEALSRPGSKAYELCEAFLSRRRALLCIDESPTIKSPNSSRARAVLQLGKLAPYRRIMTGLIDPNGPMDLYSQFEFLDWSIFGFRSFYSFRAKYAIMRKQPIISTGNDGLLTHKTAHVIVGYRKQEELAERIAPFVFRRTKEECLDLPSRTYMIREVEKTEEQARIYKEMLKQATSQLESGDWISAQLPITLMLRLQQILCGFVTSESGTIVPVHSTRIDTLLSILSEHRRKAIIWCCYREALEAIVERIALDYGPRSVAQWHGGNMRTRAEEERRFLGDTDCRWMVATQGAGRYGNTWTNADLNVYFASTHNLDHRDQSEGRGFRIGQTLPFTNIDLVVPDSIDMKILYALRAKINLSAVINRDNWREWVV